MADGFKTARITPPPQATAANHARADQTTTHQQETPKASQPGATRWLKAQARIARRQVMLCIGAGFANGLLLIAQAALIAHIVYHAVVSDASRGALLPAFLGLLLVVAAPGLLHLGRRGHRHRGRRKGQADATPGHLRPYRRPGPTLYQRTSQWRADQCGGRTGRGTGRLFRPFPAPDDACRADPVGDAGGGISGQLGRRRDPAGHGTPDSLVHGHRRHGRRRRQQAPVSGFGPDERSFPRPASGADNTETVWPGPARA